MISFVFLLHLSSPWSGRHLFFIFTSRDPWSWSVSLHFVPTLNSIGTGCFLFLSFGPRDLVVLVSRLCFSLDFLWSPDERASIASLVCSFFLFFFLALYHERNCRLKSPRNVWQALRTLRRHATGSTLALLLTRPDIHYHAHAYICTSIMGKTSTSWQQRR